MKRKYLFMLVLSCIMLVPKQGNTQDNYANEEMAKRLSGDLKFREFAQNFIVHFVGYCAYHNVPQIRTKPEKFKSDIEMAAEDELLLTKTYEKYALSFDKVLDLRNQIDNDVLRLLHEYPAFQDIKEYAIMPTIILALDYGMNSSDEEWREVQNNIVSVLEQGSAAEIKTLGTLLRCKKNNISFVSAQQLTFGLSIGEVWGCVKDALGLGGGSIISIAGLNALMHQGVQTVVRTVSAWLARRCGWIGAAITVMEFSACMWEEYGD